jgi:HYD1 signature containing ADP-ribosyltransferase
MFHYTDKSGWNAVRSQAVWRFKISKPKDPDRPEGAYFTDLEPSKTNLRVLYKKIRVPKEKQEFVFWFDGQDALTRLNGGTGRDKRILFSPVDYLVSEDRQRYGDEDEHRTAKLMENFQ